MLEVESEGAIICEILLADGYTRKHQKNYMDIINRWDDVWPAAQRVIQTLLIDYGRVPKIRRGKDRLQLTIPAVLIDECAEWSIALLRDGGEDGEWAASFQGWAVLPDESQPYF